MPDRQALTLIRALEPIRLLQQPISGIGSRRSSTVPKSRLQEEIQQTKPFETLEVEVYLNLVRTCDRLHTDFRALMKRHGISEPQYNALRILRGAGHAGLPSLAVADRMVTRVPDITRLLERLATNGLVSRCRSDEDRRVVTSCVTRKGLALLARLDEPLLDMHRDLLGHMSRKDLADLNRLLVKARSRD